MPRIVWAALFVSALGWCGPATAEPVLRKVAEVDLPGPPGQRFDYMRVDVPGRRLFVAHLGANQIYVVSLADLTVTGTIHATPGVEDVAYVPELNRLYTSNWGENRIGVVDLTTMQVIERLPTANKPDGIEYAAPFGKVYVANELAQAVSVIDVRTNRTVKTLTFPSETGMPRFDPVAGKVYVNLQDLSIMAVVDAATDTVDGLFALQGCRTNHGMALDPGHRRAFVACEGNNVLVVVDLDKRQIIATFDIGRGSDFVDFDPGLGRVYVPCSDGTMTVIQADASGGYRKLDTFPVAAGVHTVAVDPTTHRVYVTEQMDAGRAVARLVAYEAIGP